MIEIDTSRPRTEPPNLRKISKECCDTCIFAGNMHQWCNKHQWRVDREEVCDDYSK